LGLGTYSPPFLDFQNFQQRRRLRSDPRYSLSISAMGSGSLPARGKYRAYTQESLAKAVDEGRRAIASGKAGTKGYYLSAIAAKHGIPWPTVRRTLKTPDLGKPKLDKQSGLTKEQEDALVQSEVVHHSVG
jgi:hypothetical protein